jgi:hypothetical protein
VKGLVRDRGGSMILPENTISIVLFLLIASLIILVGWRFYNNYGVSGELEEAKVLLESVLGKVDLIESRGDFVIKGVQGNSEKDADWLLVGWSKGEEDRPDSCFAGKGCVCMCNIKRGFFDKLPEGIEKSCNSVDSVVCSGVEADTVLVRSYGSKYKDTSEFEKLFLASDEDFAVFSSFRGQGIVDPERRFAEYIELPSKLIELRVVKSVNKTSLRVETFTDEFLDSFDGGSSSGGGATGGF